MKKKFLSTLLIIAAAFFPIGTLISCDSGEHTGSRGGTYTIDSSGHRQYHGNTSSYNLKHPASEHSLGAGASAAIAVGCIVVVAVIILIITSLNSEPSKTKHRNKSTKQIWKPGIQEGYDGREWVGIEKWNGKGNAIKISDISDLSGFVVGISGRFNLYTKSHIANTLIENGIDINVRRYGKQVNLWLLGEDGTFTKTKNNAVKDSDKIVWENNLMSLFRSSNKEVKRYNIQETLKQQRPKVVKQPISDTGLMIKKCSICDTEFRTVMNERKVCKRCRTDYHRTQEIKAYNSSRKLLEKSCKGCGVKFKTYIETRSECRRCRNSN